MSRRSVDASSGHSVVRLSSACLERTEQKCLVKALSRLDCQPVGWAFWRSRRSGRESASFCLPDLGSLGGCSKDF